MGNQKNIAVAFLLVTTLSTLAVPLSWASPKERESPSTPAFFVTMDRLVDHSSIGVSFDTSFLDGNDPTYNGRHDLFGQYVANSGLGLYGALSASSIIEDGNYESVLGNFEVGSFYAHRTRDHSLISRFGFFLPTAYEFDFFNYVNGFGRLADLLSSKSGTTTVRASTSYIRKFDRFFFRADLGLDVPILGIRDTDNIARLNIGVGYTVGSFAVTAESVNIKLINSSTAPDPNLHSLALGAHANYGSISPFAALIRPLDHEIHGFVELIVVAGVRLSLDSRRVSRE